MFISKEELKKIISEAPEGTDSKDILAGLLKKGYVIEGMADFRQPVKGGKGDKGDTIVGPPGPSGKDSIVPGPKGDKGDPLTFNQLTNAQKAELRGAQGEPGTIKEISPQETRDLLELLKDDERLDAKYIKNLPQGVIERIIEKGGGFIETPIKGGTNVTVTKDAFGAWVISSTDAVGVPGGALTSIQYNNSGAFGGFGTFDGTYAQMPLNRITNFTSNGFLKTNSGTGQLSIDSSTYLTTSSAASTYLTIATATSTYVPYTGATGTVNLGTNQLTTSGLITGAGYKGAYLYPASDSTTALQLRKADGTTAVMTVNTTNARVGINTTPATMFHMYGNANDATTAEFRVENASTGNAVQSRQRFYTGNSVAAIVLTPQSTVHFSGLPGLHFNAENAFGYIPAIGFSQYTSLRIYIPDSNSSYFGNVGIGGVTSPSAKLHLPAGTAATYSSPLKLSVGTNMTGIEQGAMEFDGTQLYFSPTSLVRNALIQDAGTRLTSGKMPYAGANGYLADSGSFWDAANSRIGILTTSPTRDLHVNGIMRSVGLADSSDSTGSLGDVPIATGSDSWAWGAQSGGGGAGVILPAPFPVLHPGVYTGTDSEGNPMDVINTLNVYIADGDRTLFSDASLDARLELLIFRMGRGSRRGLKKTKKWRHPTNMVGIDIDPTYTGSNTRGGKQTTVVSRTTEWSLFGLGNYETIASIPVENYFKMGGISIPEWNALSGATEYYSCPTGTGQGQKSNTMKGPLPFRKGYQWKSGEGPPFVRFKFRISIIDPNGINGERMSGPESSEVIVRATPYPVMQDVSTLLWTGRDVTKIGSAIGGSPHN